MTKILLTEQRSSKVPVPVKAPDILIDAEGKSAQILERITREQFAELIKEHLDETIVCCNKALAKANMQPDELDEILLVGGSTYGQWVKEAVARAVGQQPQVYNPDLCVAAGARNPNSPPPGSARPWPNSKSCGTSASWINEPESSKPREGSTTGKGSWPGFGEGSRPS